MDDIDDVRREVREVEVNAPEAAEWGTTGRGAETTTTTQWQRPSREEAQRHGKATVFGNGRAPLWRTTAMDFAPLGEGVTLYFLMLKWFAWFFVAQTIVSLPAIVFFVSGKAIAEEELDLFSIAKTTLGNFHADNITAWLTRFHAVTEDELTEELLEDLGAIPTRPYLKSYIISALDIVNTCLFLLFSLWLKARMRNVSRKADQRFVTTADYAVLVRGLPPDATEEEVRNHFDRLYHLKKMDWTWPGYLFGTLGRKEPRLPPETRPRGTKHKQALDVTEEQIEPIHDTSHIGDPAYQGSWVCEVTLARNQGEIIRAYLARRAAQMRMNEVRAALTKYSEKSKFANKARKRAAEDELKALEARVKAAQEQIAALRQEQGNRPCREAYVIFNYQESRKRCLEDYQTYSKWWHKLPTPLRFRNGKYAIHVSPAPEPTNIKWENQGVTAFESRARQLLVAVVVVAILMGAFTLVYWCQSSFRGLRASLPDADLCVLDVPAVLLGTYNLAKLSPDLQRKPELDQFCAPSEVWLGYSGMAETEETILEAASNSSDPCASPCVSRPSQGADILCYTLSVEEGCPSTQDPLESANIDATCALDHWENITSEYIEISSELIADPEALARLVRAVESVHCCQSFQKARTLRACYCAQRLHTIIKEVGIFRALGTIEAEDDNLCQEVASDMFLAQVMSASPAVVVICVNTLIRIAMSRITKLEHHATVTDQDMSIALKILAAQFISTAIVILVLNAARASSSIAEAEAEASVSTDSLGSRIFEAGDYEDFTRTWYAVVGQAIILAMALNVVSVQAFPIFLGYVMAPLRRLYYSTYALTQERLNWAFEGLKFRVTVRYAMLINTIWVTMLYSASMPLVLPCAAMFFTCTYWFDKYAILRYYHRPPAYDASFPLLVVRTLPVALLGHAGFSFWALANDDLVPSQRLTWTAIQEYVQENATGAQLEAWSAWSEWAQSIDRLGVLYKASHLAALPQFILAIFILAYFGIYALLHTFYLLPRLRVLANILWKTLRRCFPSRRKILVHPRGKQNIRSEISRMREFLPPFTGYFIREVPSAARLSALQRKMNWHLIHNEDTGTSFEYCTWPSDGAVAGCTHARGDIMKTWELVSTHAVHSYRLESNPFYKI